MFLLGYDWSLIVREMHGTLVDIFFVIFKLYRFVVRLLIYCGSPRYKTNTKLCIQWFWPCRCRCLVSFHSVSMFVLSIEIHMYLEGVRATPMKTNVCRCIYWHCNLIAYTNMNETKWTAKTEKNEEKKTTKS